MDFKKIKRDNYSIDIINTDRFKTNLITISFSTNFKKEDIAYLTLLSSVLVYNSKKYNNKIKLSKKLEDLYLCNVSSSVKTLGSVKSLRIDLEYINSIYTEESMDKESIDLLFELVFNPNAKDNAFDLETFNLCKNNIIDQVKGIKENAAVYSSLKFESILNKGNPSGLVVVDIKDYENITNESLYEFYKKVLNYQINISILGNYNNDFVCNYIDSKLKKIIKNTTKVKDVYIKNKIKKNVLIKEEEADFSQSQLYVGYKLDDLTDFEQNYVLTIYSIILGGDLNSLLFKTVREENGLCYGIYSYKNRYNNTLSINAGIDKDNYKKCVSLIKDCVKKMNDKNIINSLLNTAKNNIYTSLNTFYDDMSSMETHYFLKNFDIKSDDITKRKEKYESITVEDIINLNKKLHLDTIYFLKGVKND